MKKGLRKLAAVVLTAAIAMSAGMPAFANESYCRQEIIDAVNAEYQVNITEYEPQSIETAEISLHKQIDEETFRLRTELLAVITAISYTKDEEMLSELQERQSALLDELQMEPLQFNMEETGMPLAASFDRVLMKSTNIVRISTWVSCTTNSSGVNIFDEVINIEVGAIGSYGWEDKNDPYGIISNSGQKLTSTATGFLVDDELGIRSEVAPQSVTYYNTEL